MAKINTQKTTIIMEQFTTQKTVMPMIVKYVETTNSGIQSYVLSRYAIGYVLRGSKYIYSGDKRKCIQKGDVFYLGVGHHYIEDVPDEGSSFEQITFYYSPSELQRAITHLCIAYDMKIHNEHSCPLCTGSTNISQAASSVIKTFFTNTNAFLRDENFKRNEAVESIKMTELIFHIATHDDCCLKSKLLSNIDTTRENFEQVVFSNIFEDISVEQLASLTNRSLTSFKKEFKRLFDLPPHKWFILRRLMHSRLLLVSTNKSISEIGIECTFPNTSHFIKLFKKEYGLTPATFRNSQTASAETQTHLANETSLHGKIISPTNSTAAKQGIFAQ